MHRQSFLAILALAASASAIAQSPADFTGQWYLDVSRSKVVSDPSAPAETSFRAQQSQSSLTLSGRTVIVYPLDGRAERFQFAGESRTTSAHWEGAALIVNTAGGPDSPSINERWERSSDGRQLTITRKVDSQVGSVESLLIYGNAPAQGTLIPRPAVNAPAPPSPGVTVTAGTHILLRLTNALDTKHASVGDHVYLETASPIFVNGRMVIPPGSYVNGSVTEAKEAGRVKGKSSLAIQYDSITLRNGIARDLRSRPDSVDTRGNLDKSEGRIQGEGNKSGDAGTIAQTTAIGTGTGGVIGAAAGHAGMGLGVGAAAGAAAGLAHVFGSRGPQVVLPRGTTMDMVVDRDLNYSDSELRAVGR